MSTLVCAKCRIGFEPDDDHAKVDLELRRINDRNEQDEYRLCMECWLELQDEWRKET